MLDSGGGMGESERSKNTESEGAMADELLTGSAARSADAF